MSDEKKYKRLLSNTATVGIGTLGSKLLVYLLVRLYTSVLSNEEFSIASNITEMATLLIPFISLGIGEAVFRFAMDKQYRQSEVFTQGFVAVGIGALLLPIVAIVFLNIDYFDSYVPLLILYILSSAIHTNCSQYIRAKAMFRLYAVQGLLNTLLTIGLNVLFLIPLNMGITGYVLSVAVADLLSSLFLFTVAKLWRDLSFKGLQKSTLKAMLLYSLPLIPTTISWWVTNVSDRYMITFMQGDSINGLYAAAYKIPTLLMVLIGIFNSAWKYSAVEERSKSDSALFFSNVYHSFSTCLILVSGGIIAFSKFFSVMMFGEDFRAAWVYIPILTLAMAFSALSSFTGTIFIVEKKSRYSLYTALVAALVNVVLNLMLIPLFSGDEIGAMGAAIATLCAYLVMFALRLFFSTKLVPYRSYLTETVLNFFVLATMALTVTLEVPFWMLWQAVFGILLLVLNRKVILSLLKQGISLIKR